MACPFYVALLTSLHAYRFYTFCIKQNLFVVQENLTDRIKHQKLFPCPSCLKVGFFKALAMVLEKEAINENSETHAE